MNHNLLFLLLTISVLIAFVVRQSIIGCELDKDYFDAAELRYQEHIKQMTLF